MASYVWYSSYGSNLNSVRFLNYVTGGQAPGSMRPNPGCHDPSPPLDVRPITLPYELYFAGQSRTWEGGGVAFIRTGKVEATKTLGRMYLMTAGQFNDVVLQENGRPPETRILPSMADLVAHAAFDLPGNGYYGRLLHIGDQAEGPIFTFTTARQDLAPNAPSESYIKTIVVGLKETYPEMKDHDICQYLLTAEGLRGVIPAAQLADWVAAA